MVFEPFYENYGPDAILSGAVPRYVKLRPPDVVRPRRAGPRVRAQDPRHRGEHRLHNPTGKVFTRAELETIAGLCRRHDVVALTDEIYEHIPLRRRRPRPIASLPGMAERTITHQRHGKTYAVTGWRVGWPSPRRSSPTLSGRSTTS